MADPTPAEIEAGAAALAPLDISGKHHWAAAVLRAVLPDHDARLRARVAEEIAAAIGAMRGTPDHGGTGRWQHGWNAGCTAAAQVARQHARKEADHG